MCGIVGFQGTAANGGREAIEGMLSIVGHRGPDELGIYLDERLAMGSARLSIIDLAGGTQPIANEDGTVWIVFNGEIFNYEELRPVLENKGHRFTTRSDTEVIVHLYEEYGPGCLEHLNGQFAMAIWDTRNGGTLMLARDRVGIHPLYYTETPHGIAFASEIKALLTLPGIEARIDHAALAQVLTLWTVPSPGTVFSGIRELTPGTYLVAERGSHRVEPYWQLTFPEAGHEPIGDDEEAAAELLRLLGDATRIRLRADVPVGAYLSGGIDSSSIVWSVLDQSIAELSTYSITFADESFDERRHQQIVRDALDTNHRSVDVDAAAIGAIFPDVVWHTETPVLRTAPAPMFLLSQLVNESGLKVVLTGEGADEYLAGYNIFREAKVRRFWARDPSSRIRPVLIRKLYPYIKDLERTGAFMEAFFKTGLTEVDRSDYSHMLRWSGGRGLVAMLTPDIRAELAGFDPTAQVVETLRAHPDFASWSWLAKAQYIESTIFMSGYLLSSQGDRMLMAHSVEGRFPFLDHRVIEFASQIAPETKMRGLSEKHVLKTAMRGKLPASVLTRTKQPYRAPIQQAFLGTDRPGYVDELLSADAIASAGYFDPRAVETLVAKAANGGRLSERDGMALTAVVSTQLVHHHFVENTVRAPAPRMEAARVAGTTDSPRG